MNREFRPLQAEEIARAFQDAGVDYLFIGKSGAILLGYPGTTQDVDAFPARSPENGRRIVVALRNIGFEIAPELEREIVAGKDFVQIKTGPFDVDFIFAPDGIASFAEAKSRKVSEGIFQVANLRDIIASKRASAGKRTKLNCHCWKASAPNMRSATRRRSVQRATSLPKNRSANNFGCIPSRSSALALRGSRSRFI